MTQTPTLNAPLSVEDVHSAETPNREHVPTLHQAAFNQMPKAGWRELKLYRYPGTDLYQWFGKRGVTSEARDWSVFEDQATEPFIMRPRQTAAPNTQGGEEREAIARVIDPEAFAESDDYEPPVIQSRRSDLQKSALAKADAILSLRPQPAGERDAPVAWRWTIPGATWWNLRDTPNVAIKGAVVEPLYTHPAPDDRLAVAVEALEPFAAHHVIYEADTPPMTLLPITVEYRAIKRAAEALRLLSEGEKG